jgi:RNA recognition motif-containing protein
MSKILVSNLHPNTEIADLASMFQTFGPVEAVRIHLAGLKPRFATIEMSYEFQAYKAVRQLNGSDFGGLPLEVDFLGMP